MAKSFNYLTWSKVQAAKRSAAKVAPAKPKKHGNYRGTDHIPQDLFYRWQKRAQKDKISFDLTIHQLEQMWLDQNGHCAVTGRPLKMERNDPDKVSLDRVDSKGLYTLQNVRFVTSTVNFVRHTLTDDELRKVFLDIQYIDTLRQSVGRGNWYARLKQEEYRRIFGRDPK